MKIPRQMVIMKYMFLLVVIFPKLRIAIILGNLPIAKMLLKKLRNVIVMQMDVTIVVIPVIPASFLINNQLLLF